MNTRHIIPISGKDSLTVALYMKEFNPENDYEYVFNPTESELPETFEWLEKVEKYLNKKIHFIGKNLIEIIEDRNFYLPSRQSRYCTIESKIQPFENWIGKDDCIVYYGIRADETRIGYINNRYPNIVPKYPLVDAGIKIDDVYKIVTNSGLKPPTFFWQRLYDEVVKLLGKDFPIKDLLKEWQIDMLFAWRSRTNCYHCFNQRIYEWIGLLEHHPDLFWTAESFEKKESEYTWMGGGRSLKSIADRADKVFKKRALYVANLIKKIQYSIKNPIFDNIWEKETFDLLFSQTSCGLFCGK